MVVCSGYCSWSSFLWWGWIIGTCILWLRVLCVWDVHITLLQGWASPKTLLRSRLHVSNLHSLGHSLANGRISAVIFIWLKNGGEDFYIGLQDPVPKIYLCPVYPVYLSENIWSHTIALYWGCANTLSTTLESYLLANVWEQLMDNQLNMNLTWSGAQYRIYQF